MSALLQALGLVAFVVAAWLISPILGLILLGLALVVAGEALDGLTLGLIAHGAASRLARIRPRRRRGDAA